jgi:uncharacterized membrane protein
VQATILWVLALLPFVGLFIWSMNEAPNEENRTLIGIGFAVVVLLWSTAMMLWMKARSEIIDFEELLKIKREKDKAAKRRSRF